MKFLLFLMITFMISCNAISKSSTEAINSHFKIIGIDSVNNFYLISAGKDDLKFEIISPKVFNSTGETITLGKSYELNLISMITGESIKNLKVIPQNRTLVSCYYFDDTTKICYKNEYVRDLYKVNNLSGLNLINSN